MTRNEIEHVIYVLSAVRSGQQKADPFWRVELQEALASCRAELAAMPKEEPQQLELDFGQQKI
jgi:hypothetical protein